MTTETPVLIRQVEEKRHGFWYHLFKRLICEKPVGAFGLTIVIILLFTGIFANFIAPYGMNQVRLVDALSPPSAKYFLGTDQLGRDVLSRIIYGARVSMIIGIVGTLLHSLVSTVIGVVSGFFGGKTDMIVQRFVDAFMSVPQLLVLLTLMSIVGSGMVQIILVLGITSGISSSRVIRSAVITIKSNTYVQATEAIGCSPIRSMIRHILPNIMAVIIVDFTIVMGAIILMEASLSFLGYGLPPGTASWGNMLSMEGQQYMESSPFLAIWPGLALTIVVYGINMFGDALRDLLDPRLRGGVGRYSIDDKKRKKMKESLVDHELKLEYNTKQIEPPNDA